jgi:peptide/nickel transport system substrate-binding protein
MRLPSRRTRALAAGIAVVAAAALTACGSSSSSAASKGLIIGTTDQVIAIDPAGSYDNGSQTLEDNLYQFLMNVPAGAKAPTPDAAQSCGFTSPTLYTCTMKPGLKFSNGDALTAEDVAFSYQRIVKINDPNGPSSLIGNMKSVAASGNKVTFTLKNPNDQTWPFVLGTSAGPIVDHKVFPADKLLADKSIVGSGPYEIASYSKNSLVQFKANPNYTGPNKAKTKQITIKYYTQADNMKLDIQSGAIDIAWRSLDPTDIASLKKNSKVQVLTGSGGELRYLVFNLKTMPGDTDAQKLAVRRAVAYSVDRQDLATNVFKGTYQPAYSMVPSAIAGATTPFKTVYGATPNKAKAASTLSAAGIKTPVSLNIDYTTDHYGPTSPDEYNEIKRQLESTGLFKVTIQGTAYTTYSTERTKDTYPIYQLGWFPDFVDADNYLLNFLSPTNFVHAHYCDTDKAGNPVAGADCVKDGILPLLTTEETKTGATRTAAIDQIQEKLATGTMPYLPLLSGNQVAVVRKGVTGVQSTLDPTYQFRMWLFSK